MVINSHDFSAISEIKRERDNEIREMENFMSTNLSIVSATKLSIFDNRHRIDDNSELDSNMSS